jgi:hypothetical protein
VRASISTPEMTVVKELLIVGGVIVLLFITLAVGKIILKDMMQTPAPITHYYLKQDLKSKN